MKKTLLALTIVGLCLGLAACQPAQTPAPPTPIPPTNTLLLPTVTPLPPTPTAEPTAAPTETPTEVPEPVLELIGPDGTLALTLEDLMALPAVEGQAGIKSSTGAITLPTPFKGVLLTDLVSQIGSLDEGMGVNIVAEDGYAISYSFDQITNGNFIAYSPATGEEIQLDEQLQVVIAYENDGQPLPKDSDGTLRVVIISSEPNQVTDGHWSVKWVNQIELMSMLADWELSLTGNITSTIDRASFESCSAPQCHQAVWTDDKAQEWTGVPLWLLLGYVDDEIKHDGPAFNDALAEAAYLFDVIAADGFSASMDSARVARNNDYVVASLVNGNPLPEEYFPLRLVGSELSKKESVAAISQIVLNLDGVPFTPAPTHAPAATQAPPPDTGDADLLITGMVENEIALAEAGLRELEVVQITAEHPKKGNQDYEGVLLSLLLEQAVVKDGAAKLILTAGDGYSAEVALADVQACTDCMVSFTDTPGELFLVMPGLPSNAWIKDIVQIEVQ
jgi:DMSO/TMAO reductase YedYZ molybdopterin-dependent catalytic subunit